MRYVSRKSSKEVIQQAEEVITTSKFGNKFHNIFPLKEIILEKIHWVQDLSAEILNLLDKGNDFTVEKTLSTKFSTFQWFIASLRNTILLICDSLQNLAWFVEKIFR